MNFLPHMAARLIGTSLMVEHAKLETILSVVASRTLKKWRKKIFSAEKIEQIFQ